jgi:hypothetical protein
MSEISVARPQATRRATGIHALWAPRIRRTGAANTCPPMAAASYIDLDHLELCLSETIQVLVNNSDGHAHSYGSHLNFLVTRGAWDNIRRKPHYAQRETTSPALCDRELRTAFSMRQCHAPPARNTLKGSAPLAARQRQLLCPQLAVCGPLTSHQEAEACEGYMLR